MEFYWNFFFFHSIILRFNSQRDGILPGAPIAISPLHDSFNSQRDGILLSRASFSFNRRLCFNSQRDGILPRSRAFFARARRCFNSQRDGILRYGRSRGRDQRLFQFPTGWNSTLFRCIAVPLFCVSIPNGMEFYWAREWWLLRFRFVSIPNGMEFYRKGRKGKANHKSFNSQRDGILLKQTRSVKLKVDGFNSQRDGILQNPLHIDASSFLAFQFPTGWNSTYVCGRLMHEYVKFQFPTGWNSTGSRLISRLEKRSFNSQRDGILRSCSWHRGS